MPHNEIDARGLTCPAPVLMVKTKIEQSCPEKITVLVDNAAAQQNVSRFLQSQQFEVELSPKGADFQITGKKDTAMCKPASLNHLKASKDTKKIMVMVTTDRLGHGDDELGRKLMASFITTLNEMGPELWRMVFVNNGVKLTIDDSGVLENLQNYARNGVHILVCGTCLNHFNLLDRKAVGEVTNMLDIVTAMQLADQVINI